MLPPRSFGFPVGVFCRDSAMPQCSGTQRCVPAGRLAPLTGCLPPEYGAHGPMPSPGSSGPNTQRRNLSAGTSAPEPQRRTLRPTLWAGHSRPGNRPLTVSARSSVSGCRRPTPDARRPTPDARRPTPDARRPTICRAALRGRRPCAAAPACAGRPVRRGGRCQACGGRARGRAPGSVRCLGGRCSGRVVVGVVLDGVRGTGCGGRMTVGVR